MMKKLLLILGTLLVIAASCEKSPTDAGGSGETPVVSISADQNFSENRTAELKLTLSRVSDSDVTVKLKDAAPAGGNVRVPANYSKTVKIKAGDIEAKIEVEADVLGLGSGKYQAAIEMVSAEGAELAESRIAYIDFEYSFFPSANLYADNAFTGNGTASVKIVLTAVASEDVRVRFEASSESGIKVSLSNEVVIPAGETEKEVAVKAEIPDGLEPGIYKAVIRIASIEKAAMGDVVSAEISLSYPFASDIVIDGNFDDWNSANYAEWTLPEGSVIYGMLKSLKLAANEKRVFMYFEFDNPANGYGAHLSQPVTAFEDNSLPMNIYLDADGDPATGAIVASVDNDTYFPPYEASRMGLEYYIELALHDVAGQKFNDFYSFGGVYRYGGKDGENVFSGLANLGGTYDGSAIYAEGTYENGTGRVEVQMSREFFGIKGNKVRLALKIMDMGNNWGCLGLLPQGKMISLADRTREHVDMAAITLPDYVQ